MTSSESDAEREFADTLVEKVDKALADLINDLVTTGSAEYIEGPVYIKVWYDADSEELNIIREINGVRL